MHHLQTWKQDLDSVLWNRISSYSLRVLSSEVGDVPIADLVSNVMQDTDAWSDADMESVITYLRGNRHLNVPSEIRKALGMDKRLPFCG